MEKIIKQISVMFSEREIVNIANTRLNDKNQISIINFHIESLYYRNKISEKDFSEIRSILLKIN